MHERALLRLAAVAAWATALTTLAMVNGVRGVTAFVHPWLFLVASYGLYRATRQSAFAALALLFMAIFATLEAVRRAFGLVGTLDPVTNDALYLVLASAYFLADVGFSMAMAPMRGVLARVVLAGLVVGATFAAINLASGYLGFAALDGAVALVYPVAHPFFRAALGAWLWRSAAQSRASPAPAPHSS